MTPRLGQRSRVLGRVQGALAALGVCAALDPACAPGCGRSAGEGDGKGLRVQEAAGRPRRPLRLPPLAARPSAAGGVEWSGMTRAAKGRSVWAAVLGLAVVLLAAALPAPASASAPSPSYAETRVWGSNLETAAGVGAERTLSPTGTEAYAARYDELAVGYPLAARGTTGAESAANRLRLQQQLASEQQVGEVLTQPRSMAGAGTARQIDDINRLVSQYGGDAADWAKVRSSSFTAADGTRFEVHAYRNVRTGETFELKTKFQ
jgi:hypothetical protein